MGLKRKRSFDGLASPPPSGSSCSESPSPAPFLSGPLALDDRMDVEDPSSCSDVIRNWFGDLAAHEMASSRLNSRTRKRLRDNRPDAHIVHGVFTSSTQSATLTSLENTYQKLYQAQQTSFTPPTPVLPRPTSTSSTTSSKQSQSTLHSFWELPRLPRPSTCEPTFTDIEQRRQCEDCDVWLGSMGDGSMEMDSLLTNNDNCRACNRLVCDTCSVQGASGKECLQCKTRPYRWVGGLGWISNDVR